MKHIALALIALSIIVGCTAKPDSTATEELAVAEVHAVKVVTTSLRPTLDLSGTLTAIPEKSAILSTPIGGQVKAISVHEGQSVHAGDTLVALDTRTAESDLARAKAALQEAQANLAMLKRGPLPQEIEAARQEAKSAAATAQGQASKLKALEPLHDRAEISAVQFDEARSNADSASASNEAASQKLKLLEAGTRKESVDMAAAKVAAAEADMAAQQLALDLSTIQSPIDGVIIELPVRQGMVVERPTIIARIIDLASLFARVRIPARSRAQVQEGSEATIALGDAGSETYAGTVARIGKEADLQTGDVDAFIVVENEEGTLQPGLSCGVKIAIPEIPGALVVPVSAVASRNGDAVVTIIRDEKAYETVVETGAQTSDLMQILKGVANGDVVATEGGYGLPDGCPVHATMEAP